MKRIAFITLLFLSAFAMTSCDPQDDIKKTELTLSIGVDEIETNSATVTVTPSVETETFYWTLFTEDYYEELIGGDDDSYIAAEIAYLREEAEALGKTFEEHLVSLLKKGKSSFEFNDLLPEREYVVCAFGINEDATITTELFTYEFTTTEGMDLDIENTVSGNTCKVEVTPENNDDTYYFGIIKKSEYDLLVDDADFYGLIMSELLDASIELNMDFKEFLALALSKGADDYTFTGLEENTEYYSYAVGLTADPMRTTEIEKESFATGEYKPVDDCTFDLSTSDVTGMSFNLNVKPSKSSTRYYTAIASVGLFNENYGGDKDKAAKHAVEIATDYGIDWETDQEYVYSGNSVVYFGGGDSPLAPETEYIVFVFGVSAAGDITTEVETIEETTGKASLSSNIITVTMTEVQHTTARFNIKTTNNDQYYYGLTKSEAIAGMSDEEVIEHMIKEAGNYINWFLFSGTYSELWTDLYSGTDYTTVVFGFSAGVVTTGLSKAEFTTL